MTTLRKLFVGTTLLAALVIVVDQAEAQRPGRGGGFGRGGPGGGGGFSSPITLLGIEAVQKEIELSEDQLAKFKEIGESLQTETRDLFSGVRDLPQDERRAKFEELREKMDAKRKELEGKLDGVLLQIQKDRLQQISLQIRGLAALDDEKIAKDLGITADQKEKMAAAREGSRAEIQELFSGLRDLPQEERRAKFGELREKMESMRADSEKAVLAVLSSDQQAKFEKMKGEKFEIDRRQLFQGRGGQRGQRQRGNRPGGDRPQRNSSDTD